MIKSYLLKVGGNMNNKKENIKEKFNLKQLATTIIIIGLHSVSL